MAGPNEIVIPPPSPDDVLYEPRDGYAIITLNRPVVLNAINWSIQRRLMAALERGEADDDAKVLILTAAGRAFSSGGDIQSTPPPDTSPTPSSMEICLKIWQMAKPVIAAVRGYAVGQGCELAGICDLTVAAEDAIFGELQIRHGFGPPILITPYLMGPKQAKEVLLLGERISAHEALRLGFVNRVVPADRVLAEAEDIARKIGALSQATVQQNKLLVNRVHELAGFREGLAYRDDEAFRAFAAGDRSDHLKVLAERGWEAFRASRDAAYGETEARG